MQFTRNVNCTVLIALVLTPLLVGAATESVGTEEKRTMLDNTQIVANGYVGDNYSPDDVETCTDAALKFINCRSWLPHVPADGNYFGTVVIMDDGLTTEQWRVIESTFYNVDIIKYLVPTSDGKGVREIGGPGEDFQNRSARVTNSDLMADKNTHHGFMVLSALASIARNVKVIFAVVKMSHQPMGFDTLHGHIWKWLMRSVNAYDIDVINMSFSSLTKSTAVYPYIKDLRKQGVFMVTSSGNEGNFIDVFPNNQPEVYTVGAVDHETRRSRTSCHWQLSWKLRVCDLESRKGRVWSRSNYGSLTFGANAVDFVMPGNGVPLVQYKLSYRYVTAKYGFGTSFSSPYLAAAALVATYAYNLGYYSTHYTYQDPTVDEVYSIFQAVSSRTSWDQKMGWGYVDIAGVFDEAYGQGSRETVICDPLVAKYGGC